MKKENLKTFFQNITLLFVSIILILLVIEIFIRATGYRDTYEADEKKALQWQYDTKRTHNSLGFRDYEYSVEKPKGVFRIFVLGDSYSYGQGLEMTETYSKVLEKTLNDKYPSKHFEVINSSFLGLDTEKEFQRLKNEGIRLSPDMVILGYCLNDPSHNSGITQWREEEEKEKIKILFNNKRLLEISDLYWFLKMKVDELLSTRIFTRSFLKLYDKNSQGWKDFENSFNKICILTKEKDIPLLVVIFPYFYQLNENYPFSRAHSQIKELCGKNGVKVLDLFDSYMGIPDKSLWVKTTLPINTHPNAKAHQIAASEIFNEISKDPYFRINNYLKLN